MISILALTALLASGSQSPDAGAKVYAAVADSVLLVIARNEKGEEIATGSAFVVDGGRLITNAHVVAEGNISVKSGVFTVPCTVEKIDPALDLALLKPTLSINSKPLVIATRVPPPGSTIFAIGNPQGLERTISLGLLTGNRTIEDRKLLQVSAAISPGSSGGPVVTPEGEVVGVATYFLQDGQNLNFAVPASIVRQFLDNPAPALRTQPNEKLADRTLQALERSKLRYEKVQDGIWVVKFEGENLATIEVYVLANNEQMVVVSSRVREKPYLSSEVLRRLLVINFETDYSKVALDDDGDLMALTELPPEFTAYALRQAIDNVATLADSIAPLAGAPTSVAAPPPPPPSAPAFSLPPNVRPGRGATVPILRGAYELSYDPAKWRQETVDGQIRLQHLTGDAYLSVIDERLQFSLDGIRDSALENMKAAASAVRLEGETTRQINGLNVRVIRYSGLSNGANFTFFSQLYASAEGTVQLAGWTGSNLFSEYESEFLELFAGFRRVR